MIIRCYDGASRSREAKGGFFYLQSKLVKLLSADVRSQNGLSSQSLTNYDDVERHDRKGLPSCAAHLGSALPQRTLPAVRPWCHGGQRPLNMQTSTKRANGSEIRLDLDK
jgi:hypothetical protein